MGQVEVTINGRPYQVACDDGEEDHLVDLAKQVDKRVDELAGSLGQVGEARLILMAGLLLADELSEARGKVGTLETKATEARDDGASAGRAAAEKATQAMDNAAQRIEAIVARLESA